MGSSKSRNLEPPKLKFSEIEDFSRQSLLPVSVIEHLYLHFYRISSLEDDDGVIDLKEFYKNVQNSPLKSELLDGVFRLFDINNDGVINFREFLQGISIFNKLDQFGNDREESPVIAATKLKDQIEFSVRLLDNANKKKIYLNQLKQLLFSAISECGELKLKESDISKIVDKTFEEEDYSEDDHGKYLTIERYSNIVLKNPQILKWLSVDLERIGQGIEKSPKRRKRAFSCF